MQQDRTLPSKSRRRRPCRRSRMSIQNRSTSRPARSTSRPGWRCTACRSACACSRSVPRPVPAGPGEGDQPPLAWAWRRSPPGSAWPMRADDWTFATYRGHAHALARGADPEAVMRELLGLRGRHLRRQGRLDAHHERRARLTSAPTRSSVRTCRSPAGARAGRRRLARRRRGHRVLLRRRRDEHRRLPRGGEPRRRMAGSRSSSCARTTSTWSTRRSAP